jgi:ABC-type lipoprotein release transport system permease subunit
MFSLTVAWRYLTSNTWQSALLIAGVALGVMAYVFITALVQGLAIRLTDDVTANSAHISLEPPITLCPHIDHSRHENGSRLACLDASAQADPELAFNA